MSNGKETPILKWVGGKRKLLHHLLPKFPKKINNYHELFTGGGSVLIGLLKAQKANEIIVKKNIYAYDSNSILIAFYKQIQKDYSKLYTEVLKLKNGLINQTTEEDKSLYYYNIRAIYNDKEIDIEKIAMFLFLNKTCWRGVFRLNKKGGFNVPYGHYKSPEIVNEKHLKNVSELIKNVEFICCDFEDIKKIKKGDFVYMDPPYVPVKKGGFVSYSKVGFTKEKHEALFKLCNDMKCKWALSNSNTEIVRENLNNHTIEEITARRAINSTNPAATVKEVIIYN
jgi:DNA adenine methylase